MSTSNQDMGERLRQERERLGLNQDEFSAIGGVQRRAQVNYEAGSRAPDAQYLAALAGAGVDVSYVLTGVRASPIESSMSREEEILLTNYRRSLPEDRAAMRKMGAAFGAQGSTVPRKRSANGDD